MKKVFLFLCCCSLLWAKEDLDILKNWMAFTDSENALYHYLSDQAFEFLDARQARVDTLQTLAAWQSYQDEVRSKLDTIFGAFPEKTELDVQVRSRIKTQAFTIEKLVFQSQPGFYVTGACVVPNHIRGKAPAVIYCCGHTLLGWRAPTYQKIIFNLAAKGFIVFAFDPIGQGERIQYYDSKTQESNVGGITLEHSYVAAQCFLRKSSVAKIMTWDGIRAIDYLLSRGDVDPERIGITGRSGGGTQSTYIAALDDRITAVAPECYITRWQRLLQSDGPQDGEQNLYHFIANGLDFPDFLTLRAPKPALQISTTRDFFSIQGSMETAAEVEKAYRAFGACDDYAFVYDDSSHASTKKNREALYAFFQKSLNNPGDPHEESVTIYDYDKLLSTRSGQVAIEYDSHNAYDLNRRDLHTTLDTLRAKRRRTDHLDVVKKSAAELAGYKTFSTTHSVFCGQYKRSGYFVEKRFIENDGYPIPFLIFRPDEMNEKFPLLLYLHPDGKAKDSEPGGRIEKLVKRGYMVIAADLIGTGERGPGDFKGDSRNFKHGRISFNIWFLAEQIGSSIAGVQATEVSRLVDYAALRSDVDMHAITGIAFKEMCPILQHVSAVDDRLSRMVLNEPLVSYASLAAMEYYWPLWIHSTVVGALIEYDLPDLLAAFAPKPLLIINPLDQLALPLTKNLVDHGYNQAEMRYADLNASENIMILMNDLNTNYDNYFYNWLK